MEIEVERQDGVAIVRLNRPEKYNLLNEAMKAQLLSAFADFAPDEGVRAIVLTGRGRAFCAGGDVSTMGAFTAKSLKQRLSVSQRMLLDIDAMDKPVIASVRGAVAGIGWSLALVCDQIFASDTVYFSQSFKNIGAVPDGGAMQLLLIFAKNMTTAELFVRYVFRLVPGEYGHGAKAIERGCVTNTGESS